MKPTYNPPQKGKGYSYHLLNTGLLVEGNLAIPKELGKILLTKTTSTTILGIKVIYSNKNWRLHKEVEYSFHQIQTIEALYQELKNELQRIKHHLIELYSKELNKKLHGTEEQENTMV